jgi:hypothetical protein
MVGKSSSAAAGQAFPDIALPIARQHSLPSAKISVGSSMAMLRKREHLLRYTTTCRTAFNRLLVLSQDRVAVSLINDGKCVLVQFAASS